MVMGFTGVVRVFTDWLSKAGGVAAALLAVLPCQDTSTAKHRENTV